MKTSTVILIDDDAALLAAAARFLRHHGFDVRTSSTAFGMSYVIQQLKPDAIVVDMIMPALDGRRFGELIREQLGDGIPIVMWSGSNAHAMERVARELGNATFAPKADGRTCLLAALNKVMRRASDERAKDSRPPHVA